MLRRCFENVYASRSEMFASLAQGLIGDSSPCNVDNPKLRYVESSTVEWTWDVESGNNFVETLNDGRDVRFHRQCSSGTAVVRGSQPMSHGQHFWEIQMISPVFGTDVMVGIGTAEADMSQLDGTYTSLLGKDNHTWGFSYKGSFYHNGEVRTISTPFGEGSVIGLHLDLWNGTLSLYKDNTYLGVASRGLRGRTLYAMASSTINKSKMRLLRTCSFPSSLLFLCCYRLREIIPDDKPALGELDIPPRLKLSLQNNLSWLLSPRLTEQLPCKDQKTQCGKLSESSGDQSPGLKPLWGISFRRIPCTTPDFNRFQRRAPSTPVPQPSEEEAAAVEDDLGEGTSANVGNQCKRPRYSYNYEVGLSDHDSDSEMEDK